MHFKSFNTREEPPSRLIYIAHNPTGQLVKVLSRYVKVYLRKHKKITRANFARLRGGPRL